MASNNERFSVQWPQAPFSTESADAQVTSPPASHLPSLVRSATTAEPLRASEDAVRLAARLRAGLVTPPALVVFAGLERREGASTVAAEVAVSLARMSEDPLLLLDANLRAPSCHVRFKTNRQPGFSDVVLHRASLQDAVSATPHRSLYLMPAGLPVMDIPAMLSSVECARFLAALRRYFWLAVLDAPPLLKFMDGALVGAQADGTVLVMAPGRHRPPVLQRLKHDMEAMDNRMLGALLCEQRPALGPARAFTRSRGYAR